ncbi:HSP20-like chaperone [Phakopsora pachyrhizi]|uniref:HSP20-like chaperone n=1 Tax=Phakopsora pachyrhizi TaxID=170000 RepID=A0AAV0AZ00_PHAPC|nr:HSP20-like chaperone [Phakopsora pachyrhizi]
MAATGTKRKGPPTNSKDIKSTAGSSAVSKVFRPKIDVVETDDSFVMTAELAGAKKDNIAIDLHSGRLTISGQTKSSNKHSEGNVRVLERTFGSFTRAIALPQTVSHEQIKASFNEGVLQVVAKC